MFNVFWFLFQMTKVIWLFLSTISGISCGITAASDDRCEVFIRIDTKFEGEYPLEKYLISLFNALSILIIFCMFMVAYSVIALALA